MVQVVPRYCPRCSAPLAENQRICARCGFNLDASLSSPNIHNEPYPGQQGTQLPRSSNNAPQQVSQYPLPGQVPQISQYPPAPHQVSQHPLPIQPQQVSQHSLPPLQPQQISQHPEANQLDEVTTQAQPVVNSVSSPPLRHQQQHSQHPEAAHLDEVPTQAQPIVKPVSSPQLVYPQQFSQHPEAAQQDGVSMQAPSPVKPTPSPLRKRGKKLGLILVLLVVLALLSVVGYEGYTYFGHKTLSQTPITTTIINSAVVNYAGVDVTVLSAQRSQIFLDDPNITNNSSDQTTSAMIRLNLQAQNKATVPVNVIYDKIAHLVLPGGRIVNPIYVKSIPAITPGMTQTAKVDFVVPATNQLDQLILRLGATNEAQMDVPLIANADLSNYMPKTAKLTGSVVYQGLNWSLVNATSQLSVDGQQARSGMHFVIVTLSVANTLEQPAIPGSPFDYLRLQAGNITASPQNSTLPLIFAKGDTDKTGSVTFLVPQDATTLTLVFQQTSGFDSQTLVFHL